MVVPNGPFDKVFEGVTPFVLANTAAAGFRKTWVLTMSNNLKKETTFKDWYIVCNGVSSDKFSTTFLFTPAKLAAGTIPSSMSGTYYSNAAARTIDASTWFANAAVNTGLKCTFTADPKANGNISFDSTYYMLGFFNPMFTVKNQAAEFTSTTNKLSCTSDQQSTAVDQTFSYTWTGCKVAAISASVTAPGGSGASYVSFQGVKGTGTHSVPDITSLFFVNQDCPPVSGVQGVATPAATSDCKPTTALIQTLAVVTTSAAPTSSAATLINGVKYGYSSSL